MVQMYYSTSILPVYGYGAIVLLLPTSTRVVSTTIVLCGVLQYSSTQVLTVVPKVDRIIGGTSVMATIDPDERRH
jgi:hypothetical protein